MLRNNIASCISFLDKLTNHKIARKHASRWAINASFGAQKLETYTLVQKTPQVDQTKINQKNSHIHFCEKSTIDAQLFVKCTVNVTLKTEYQLRRILWLSALCTIPFVKIFLMGYQIRAFCVIIKNENIALFIHFDVLICFIRLIFLEK